MHKILRVGLREYVETVKTKTFLLGLLMVPVIVVAVVLVSSRVSDDGASSRGPLRLGLSCEGPDLLAKVEAAFDEHNLANSLRPIFVEPVATTGSGGGATDQGKQALRNGRIDAYAVLAPEGQSVRLYTHKPKPAHMEAFWTVEGLLRQAVVDWRCEQRGLDRAVLDEIRQVPIQRVELGSESGQERVQDKGHQVARMMVPFAFMYLIFMGIVTTGQQMLSSIIEEKNSRIVEVLLSAVSPFELMAGKIVGLAGIGLTVTALWAGAAYIAVRRQGLDIDVSGKLLVCFGIYYLLGFVLFSALLAGVGSVCNTLKETQSLMMPVMLVLIIPLISWMKLAQDPNGVFARVLSYIPPATPMVMVLRLSTGSNVWIGEIIGTMVILAAGVLATVWIAGKVFRTGILMYGKRPGPREILRWLCEK